jgi:hypothetical protein
MKISGVNRIHQTYSETAIACQGGIGHKKNPLAMSNTHSQEG